MEPDLDALLTTPSNDAEFEVLWTRVMRTAPSRPELFPAPPQRRINPAEITTAESAIGEQLSTTQEPPPASSTRPSAPVWARRTKPVTVVRAPPAGLIQGARPARRFAAVPPAKRNETPIIGVRVQRSSSMNARKLAALIAEPPSLPGRGKKQAVPKAQQDPKRDQLTALFGDALSDLEDDRPPVSIPPPRDNTTATTPRRAAAISPSVAEPGNQDADETRPISISSESTTQQRERHVKVTSSSQPATATPAAAPITATTDGIATPAQGGTTTANRAALRPDRPPIPIRVRDDLTVYVPYYAATVSRVYKVRLANRRFTLRFSRNGQYHYVRKFPA
ncbi:uncharacterized protein DKFZp434B061-like [Solenopsis invicta]|uniref:uncharacterized protein DKFZp434B061-like n=1 Tax=Solenopsis invicta TaxID=13686 RepID=UPI000E33DB41|nr:uncharacterized protein DKFZp434B061-like [Solenopsis invicta]